MLELEDTSRSVAYPGLDRLELPDSDTPVLATSRLADGIENKTLEFDIEVVDAVFNKPGRYFLKMTVTSSFTKNYSKNEVNKSFIDIMLELEDTSRSVAYPGLDRLELPDSDTPVLATSRLADGIENKTLEFDIEVVDAVFNKPGRYFLKMTVISSFTNNYSKILLRPWPEKTYHRSHEALSSVTTQHGTPNNPQICVFEDRKFTFRLPEGFCKNDQNHDVYLLLEAFVLPLDDYEEEGKKVGESKVAIYPRTNAPRTKHDVEAGEDMYRHTPVVTLVRTSAKTEETEMHCGRMRCTFALRHVDLEAEERQKREENLRRMKKKTPVPLPTPSPRIEISPFKTKPRLSRTPPGQEPTVVIRQSPPIVWGEKAPPETPSPPPLPHPGTRMLDSPLPDYDHTTYSANQTWRHTARKGKQQFDIIFHSGNNVPWTTKDNVPQPYITIKTSSDKDKDRKARAKTHAVVRPTIRPLWEEMVTMEIDDKHLEKESLILTVGDAISRDELVFYSIPASKLKPFHPYHIEMVMPTKGNKEGGVKLYASIVRKENTLPRDPASPNYLGLEVFLRGVRKPLSGMMGPIMAVARIVPDYYNYKNDQLLSTPRTAGITMDSISFPNPHLRAFAATARSSHGHPQVSLPGRPEERPFWNHPYLFCDEKDKGTMFTPNAALVIEYYKANAAVSNEYWNISHPIGFSSLLLDQKMYETLCQDKAKMGIRLDGVRIKGHELRSADGTQPEIGLVLKLILTDQPDSLVGMSNLDNLPSIEVEPRPDSLSPDYLLPETPADEEEEEDINVGDDEEEGEEMEPGLYLQRLGKSLHPIKDGELPPYDAVESILPEYQYIFVDPKSGDNTDRSTKIKPAAPSRTVAPSTYKQPVDLEQTHMSVLDQQMRDLDNYRTAVTRMGQDILTLRTEIRSLHGTNSKLRTDLQHYDDSRKLLIGAHDLDSLAKPELAHRYASLRQKLAAQTTEMKEYKNKVQRLQNELIKKNDKEKDYLKMTHAHASQQELLQRLQEKVKMVRKLEETCKKQERVIEKLESVLRKFKDKSGKGGGAFEDANAALSEENKRLRQQNDDLKDQLTRAGMGGGDDMEKLELYQALERAEGRVMSLEKQLQQNARNWGKERADLNLRMNEAEHGFGRSGGMVLHDYPVLESSYGIPSRLGPLLR